MVTGRKHTVFIADDHRIFREGIKYILSDTEFSLIGEASSGEKLLEEVTRLRPDILVLDFKMPDFDFFEAHPQLKKKLPEIGIILLTGTNNLTMYRKVVDSGVNGFVLKEDSSDILLKAFTEVAAGRQFISKSVQNVSDNTEEEKLIELLTSSEQNVLKLSAQGLKNREIGDMLGIKENTVEFHRRNIKKKLNIRSSAEMVRFAVENNLF